MAAERHVPGACPLDCPDTCAWVVTGRDGAAVELRGDRAHPYTRGALCAKVHRYLDYTRAPDRLLHPMRRVGPKGEGRFARISWDEALDEIAGRWREIIARHGPAAIWPYYGSGTMGMLQGVAGAGRRLWNVLGTSQHVMTICTIAGGYGTGYTLGDNRVGMDQETLAYDTRGFFRGNWPALWRDDLRPPGTRRLNMTRLGEALLEVHDPPVASMLIYASNPLASVPDQGKARRGLAREDLFTVVVENFQTDTADYADLLLPGTMQTEHADLHYSYGHIYLNRNEPAVPAPGEYLPHTEIFRRLARRLGVTEPCVFDGDDDLARAVLASDDAALAGITLERLQRDGWARLSVPTPFVPFTAGFPTPSGKLEFFAPRMIEAGLDPVPDYTPSREAAQRDTELAARYPLALIAPASHYLLNSMFANVPDLERRQGSPSIVLHPDAAAARGLLDGDLVRVHNDRGEFRATVRVSDTVRPGMAAANKGFWPKRVPGPPTPTPPSPSATARGRRRRLPRQPRRSRPGLMTLAEYVGAGAGPGGPRARPHGSPVAVTRSGLGSLGPPIPQGGLGRGRFELWAAREPSPALARRPRLAMMARPRAARPGPGANVFRESH